MCYSTVMYTQERGLYVANGFTFPELEIRSGASTFLSTWGMIPAWTKSADQAHEMRALTLNARSETIFEKPSFRAAIIKRRALLDVNGFIEWRHEGKVKIPHYITQNTQWTTPLEGKLSLGVIYEEWTDRVTGELYNTFSIVTTRANALLSYIHNNKLRMPVIIPATKQELWLDPAATRNDLQQVMEPIRDGYLSAWPIAPYRNPADADLHPVGPTQHSGPFA